MKYSNKTNPLPVSAAQLVRFLREGSNSTMDHTTRNIFSTYFTRKPKKSNKYVFGSQDAGLIPISMFGCQDLYLLVDGKTLETYSNELQRCIDWSHGGNPPIQRFSPKTIQDHSVFMWSKVPNDTPIILGTNAKLVLGTFYDFDPLMLYNAVAISNLIPELNDFYTANYMGVFADFQWLKIPPDSEFVSVEEDDPEFYGAYFNKKKINEFMDKFLQHTVSLETAHNVGVVHRKESHLIISYPGTYIFSQERIKGDEIFVQIGQSGVWQRMGKKQYKHLARLLFTKIGYAKTDNPRFMSNVTHKQEFECQDVKSLVSTCVLLCLDMDIQSRLSMTADALRSHYEKYYDTQCSESDSNLIIRNYAQTYAKEYEAISIETTQQDSTASILLTQEELGIQSNEKHYFEDSSRSYRCAGFRFCLLNLVEDVAQLQHSRTKDPYGGH